MRILGAGVVVAIALAAGCGDNAEPPVDAAADQFGQPCENEGFAPLETCHAGDAVGWCIAPWRGAGFCRRACGDGCRAGETQAMVFNDCYCQPAEADGTGSW